MRGHIRKRGKDSYAIKVSVGKDVAGKYKFQWTTVKGTKKDAEKQLSEILTQLDKGTFLKPAKTTVSEYLERWLKDYVWPNLAPRTSEGYDHICHHYLIPSLGNMNLMQIKPEHLQKYYSEKISAGLSSQTVRHHHTALHKALQTAVEWGLLLRNPADTVRLPTIQQAEMQTWREEDIYTFLGSIKTTSYYPLFHLALFSGMRRSELLALRWCDVDLLLCEVYVTRALHVLKGGVVVIRSPKTAKGRRMVALPPSSVLVLKEHREKQKLERMSLGKLVADDDLVFSTLEGKPLLPNTVTHAWIKLVHRAGVKRIGLHDARHTHATLMLKQGIHPKIVQERLGHASIQITLDRYSHVAPGLQEAAAKRFDEALTMGYNNREKETISSKMMNDLSTSTNPCRF